MDYSRHAGCCYRLVSEERDGRRLHGQYSCSLCPFTSTGLQYPSQETSIEDDTKLVGSLDSKPLIATGTPGAACCLRCRSSMISRTHRSHCPIPQRNLLQRHTAVATPPSHRNRHLPCVHILPSRLSQPSRLTLRLEQAQNVILAHYHLSVNPQILSFVSCRVAYLGP